MAMRGIDGMRRPASDAEYLEVSKSKDGLIAQEGG
jgi:hypothetical protein